MEQLITNDITWFQLSIFKHLDNLVTHGIFTRRGGVSQPPFDTLNAGPTVADDPSALAENYRRIQQVLSGHPRLVSAIPGQQSEIIEITREILADDEKGATAFIMPRHVDGLLTQVRGIGLFWAVADCGTMMMVDPVHKAIAMVHGGWRGTSLTIAIKAIHMMENLYGTRSSDLYIGIGPTIGPCCYEVDEKVRQAFQEDALANEHACFTTTTATDSKGEIYSSLRLDIAASNRAQLLAQGVPEEHIELSGICTGCHRDLFFSNRLEGSTGRFAVVLALNETHALFGSE